MFGRALNRITGTCILSYRSPILLFVTENKYLITHVRIKLLPILLDLSCTLSAGYDKTLNLAQLI